MKRKLKLPRIRFSFDRVEYCSKEKVRDLQNKIKSNSINDLFFEKIKARRPKDTRRLHYKSYIGGMPKNNKNIFKYIDETIIANLSYIEIANDVYCKDEQDAINRYNKLKSIVYVKYNRFKINTMKFKKNPMKGFFHDELLCAGTYRRFQFVIYPRYCKHSGRPILRKEFRIARNKKILSKMKIPHEKYIPDPKICYRYLVNKYIKYGSLNRKKVRGLISLRRRYVNIETHIDFCLFVNREKNRDLSSESEKYKARLKRPLSYYMDELL